MKFSPAIANISTLAIAMPSALVTILTFPAAAATLISSSGTWHNPVGGAETIEYVTTGDEALILWGGALSSGAKSGLGYSGAGFSTIASEIPFLVGTLRHFNNPIAPPNVTAVTLQLNLNLTDVASASVNRSFTFDFAVDETTNTAPCLYASIVPCADQITFLNATASETFEVAGTFYTLELLGFSDRPTLEGRLVNEFISQERETNTAFLFGRLTKAEPETVPEPGAIASFALFGLYFAQRQRTRKPH